MTDDFNDKKTDEYVDKKSGKFKAGTPGKPKGARHRIPVMAEKMAGKDFEKIVATLVRLALDGDVQAAGLLVNRRLRLWRVRGNGWKPSDTCARRPRRTWAAIGDSEARQRAAIESYAKQAGFVIVDWFYDAAVKGAAS